MANSTQRLLLASSILSVWLFIPLSTARAASPNEVSPSRAPVVGESRWRPSDPIRVGRSNAYLDLGLVGTVAAGGSTTGLDREWRLAKQVPVFADGKQVNGPSPR